MTAVAEASSLLRSLAQPWRPGDKIKDGITRVARRVSVELKQAGYQPISFTRCEDLWRERAKWVRSEEMDAIRRAARRQKVEEDARAEVRSIDQLIAKIEQLESAVREVNPNFDRAPASPTVPSVGARHRSLDRGER